MDSFQIKEFTSHQLTLLMIKTGYSKERIKEIQEAFTQIIKLEIEGAKAFDLDPDDDMTQREIGDKTDIVISHYKLPTRNDPDNLKKKPFLIWEYMAENNQELFLVNKMEDLFENTFQDLEYEFTITPKGLKLWEELKNKKQFPEE